MNRYFKILCVLGVSFFQNLLFAQNIDIESLIPVLPNSVSFTYLETSVHERSNTAKLQSSIQGDVAYNFSNGSYSLNSTNKSDDATTYRKLHWDGNTVKSHVQIERNSQMELQDGIISTDVLPYGEFPPTFRFLFEGNYPKKPNYYFDLLKQSMLAGTLNHSRTQNLYVVDFSLSNKNYKFEFDLKTKTLQLIKISVNNAARGPNVDNTYYLSKYIQKDGYKFPTHIVCKQLFKVPSNSKTDELVSSHHSVITTEIDANSIVFNKDIIDTVWFSNGTFVRDLRSNTEYMVSDISMINPNK